MSRLLDIQVESTGYVRITTAGSSSAHRRLTTVVNHLTTSSDLSVSPALLSAAAPKQEKPVPDQTWDDLKFVKLSRYGRVGLITLNRPQALNALSDPLIGDIVAGINKFNDMDSIGAIVMTGEGKAFAAGADIKEMVGKDYHGISHKDKFELWEVIGRSKLPIVAAVNGVALGGGCEIAMMCDVIIASKNAKFGQPEIKLGVIPGAGGTQRLVRAIGKSKAMDMILTGRTMDADEAERSGLVSFVVPPDQVLHRSLEVAKQISNFSRPVVIAAKDSINAAFETDLQHGVKFERRTFQGLFALKDKTEGMKAFIEKRAPAWTHS